jgi:hypothetical protein
LGLPVTLEQPVAVPWSLPTPALEPEPEQARLPGYRVIDGVFNHCANLLEVQSQSSLTTFYAVGNPVSVIRFTGSKPLDYLSNNIFVHGSNPPTRQDIELMVETYKSFLRALGPDLLGSPDLRNARFIVTTKRGADEFATIFETGGDKFGAIMLKLNAPAANCAGGPCLMADVFEEVIAPWVEPVAGKGRVYVIGDDLELLDPTRLAERFRCEVMRRPGRLQKNINNVERRLAQLQDRRLDSTRTVFINGLPRNEAEAVQTGYQRNQVRELQDMAAKMDELASQFSYRPTQPGFLPQDLQELFIRGQSDVVFIVAHSDKERIYINGVPVSVEEIKNYPDRFQQSSRPRICILLSCYGGNFGLEKGLLSKRGVASLAEVLVSKGYFDKVVAPRGEITPSQATLILRDYFSGKPIREIAPQHLRQLLQIAEAGRGTLPGAL